MKVPQISFNYLCYVLLQCIDLDLDLLIIFLSSEISLFLCFDLDLGFPLVLFWLNWLFV